MRIQRKTVSILMLTPDEVAQFHDMLAEAANGHTVHYSERQTGPSQFFGVSVDERHKFQPAMEPKRSRNGDKSVHPMMAD